MDFKQLMIQHGEKVALGVSIGLFALYLAAGVVLGSADPTSAVASKGETLQGRVQDNPAPQFPRPDYLAMARGPWDKVEAAKPGKDGNVYYKTEIVIVVQEEGAIKPVVIALVRVHKAPTLQSASASIGKVSLKWAKNAETSATIATYQVFRKKEGEKDWGKPQEVPGGESTWDDTNIEAKREYKYRIKSVAKDKDPKKVDNFEQDSNEVSVRSISDIEVILKGGSLEKAQIAVKKFINQKWEQATFIVEPGKEIGEPRKVYVGRDQITIDYATHYKLIELKKEKREVVLIEEVTEKDEQGNNKRVKKEKKFLKDALKMVYTDDEGKKQEEWQAE